MSNSAFNVFSLRLLLLSASIGGAVMLSACIHSGMSANHATGQETLHTRWEVHDVQSIKRIPSGARWIAVYGATDDLVRQVCAFSMLEKLEIYAAENQAFTDLSMERISALTQIRHLEVIDAQLVGDNGLRSVARLPHLKRLVLHDGSMTRAGIEELAAVRSLQELILQDLLGDAASGLPAIARRLNLVTLELQSLAGLNDELVQSLAEISTLKYLRINACAEFTGATLASIATKCPIEHLDLSFNHKIANGAFAYIARFPGLRRLTLQHCPTISALSLEQLVGTPKLAELDLYGCAGVSDDAIGPLLQIGGLESLVVTQTGMTRQGIEELQTRLQGVRVYG